MTATLNLELPYIASSQAQKEVTHNEALDLIDDAIAGLVAITLTDADTLLTDEQVTEGVSLVFSGTLSAARTITFPAKKKMLLVKNSTTGGYALNMKITGSSVTVSLTSGKQKLIYLDGTDIVEIATSEASSSPPYDVGGSYLGSPGSSLVILRFPIPRSVQFPTNLAGSYGVAGTAATSTTTFTVAKNGTGFGTMVFAGSATTATFTGTQTTFVAGDILTLVAPASADATLADIGFAFAGLRL